MLVTEVVSIVRKTGEIETKHINDAGTSDFRAIVQCEDCGKIYTVRVANRKSQFAKNPQKREFCSVCQHTGERNHSFGKDRSTVLRHARTFQKINGMKGNHHSSATRQLQSKIKADAIAAGTFNIASNNRGKKSWYLSTKSNALMRADSMLERAYMMQLDACEQVSCWSKAHGIRVPYCFDGHNRTYVPDFKIEYLDGTISVVEVKGRTLDIDLVKHAALLEYCNYMKYKCNMIRTSDVPSYKQLLKDSK